MTSDQIVTTVVEGDPDQPDAFPIIMRFLGAAHEAGIGHGVRGARQVKRSDDPDPFIRMSIYPDALELITRLLWEHTAANSAAEAKTQTAELLHALAGDAGRREGD